MPDGFDEALYGPDGAEPATRRARAASERRRRGVGWKILIGLLALALIAVGVYAAALLTSFNRVEKVDEAQVLPDYAGRPDAAPAPEGGHAPMNILLLGSDSRDAGGASLLESVGSRSDTIMVANVSGDRKHVTVVSFMRDSFVEIPGYGMSKINAAYSYGGVPLLVQTLEGLIGQRIDHVAAVDFEGFKGITEALGGVTLRNEVEFSASPGAEAAGAHFAAGEITIADGAEALSYVRERYAFQDGDFQRVRNQQAFLRGVLDGVLSRDTLANPIRVQQLAGSLGGYVVTDSGLDLGAVAGLASQLQGLRGGDVEMFTLPTLGTGMEGDQSVVYVDTAAVEQMRAAWAADELAAYEPPAA